MKALLLITTILIAALGCGCTPRNYYEGLRLRQEMDCQKLQGADHDECLRKSGMTYDEYQKQLKDREQRK